MEPWSLERRFRFGRATLEVSTNNGQSRVHLRHRLLPGLLLRQAADFGYCLVCSGHIHCYVFI